MTKTLGLVVGLLVVSAWGHEAHAGERFSQGVLIHLADRNDAWSWVRFSGAFGTTRNTGGETERLYCTVFSMAYNDYWTGRTVGSRSASCFARSESWEFSNQYGETEYFAATEQNEVSCYTNVPELVDQIASLSSDAFISVIMVNGECRAIQTFSGSHLEPKAP